MPHPPRFPHFTNPTPTQCTYLIHSDAVAVEMMIVPHFTPFPPMFPHFPHFPHFSVFFCGGLPGTQCATLAGRLWTRMTHGICHILDAICRMACTVWHTAIAWYGPILQIGELVVVCNPEWRNVFDDVYATLPEEQKKPLVYALPGKERQDSVFNGLSAARADAGLVAIHDTARPVIRPVDAAQCMADAMETGAAVLGVPVKPTIKEVGEDGRVVRTLNRSLLWEVQTPQCIRPGLLKEGFDLVARENLEVTEGKALGLARFCTRQNLLLALPGHRRCGGGGGGGQPPSAPCGVWAVLNGPGVGHRVHKAISTTVHERGNRGKGWGRAGGGRYNMTPPLTSALVKSP